MARRYNSYGSTKPITANVPVVFTPSELGGDKLVAIDIAMAGTGCTLSATGLTRIIVRAGADAIVDIDQAHFIAFIRRFSRANVDYTTAARFVLPLYLLTAPTEDLADRCQFPGGRGLNLELRFGAAPAGACTVTVNTVETDAPAQFYPTLRGTQMNVAGVAAAAPYPFSESGEVRGFTINTTNLNRLRMELQHVVRGREVAFDSLNTNGAFGNLQDLEGGYNATLFNPVGMAVSPGYRATPGKAILDLAAGFGASNELTLWAINELAAPAA